MLTRCRVGVSWLAVVLRTPERLGLTRFGGHCSPEGEEAILAAQAF